MHIYIYYQSHLPRAWHLCTRTYVLYMYMHTLVRRADNGCVLIAPRWFFSMSLTVMLSLYTYILYRPSRLYRARDRCMEFLAEFRSRSLLQRKERRKEKRIGDIEILMRILCRKGIRWMTHGWLMSVVLIQQTRMYSNIEINREVFVKEKSTWDWLKNPRWTKHGEAVTEALDISK